MPIFIIFISSLRTLNIPFDLMVHTLTVNGTKSCTTQSVRKGGFISAMINFHTPPEWCRIFSSTVPPPYNTRIFSSILFRLIEVFNFMEKYGMPDRPKNPECLVIGVRW